MSVGECICDDGYIGLDCSIGTYISHNYYYYLKLVTKYLFNNYTILVCPAGSYGAGCLQNCTCVAEQESSPCDHIDGTCHCLPGYNGSSCELGRKCCSSHCILTKLAIVCIECSEGFYGQDCMEVCQCRNGASCDFITGQCNCTIGFIGRFCNMSKSPLIKSVHGPCAYHL